MPPPILSQNIPDSARQGLARLGLEEAATELFGGAEDFIQSEKAHRAAERREVLDLPSALSDRARDLEVRNNDAGLRRFDRVTEGVRRARESWDRAEFRQVDDAARGVDFRGALERAQRDFFDAVAEEDLPRGDAEELRSLWEDAAGAVRQNGLNGLGQSLQRAAERVRSERGSPGRGRQPHSPLPSWKYWLIAGALVIGIAAVVACFWWWGCSWIKSFLSWAAPEVYKIVVNGC